MGSDILIKEGDSPEEIQKCLRCTKVKCTNCLQIKHQGRRGGRGKYPLLRDRLETLVTQGATETDISAELGVSVRSVKKYIVMLREELEHDKT